MFDNETAGTQEALESPQDSVDQGIIQEETTAAAPEEEAGDLFPSTPPPEKAVPAPQAHRAVITGVTAETSAEKGTRYLKFSYQSKETASADALMVFLPLAFIENPQIDAATLSDEPGPISATSGRPGPSERQKYATNVRNSKGDATIQVIKDLAVAQGHSVSLPSPRTFEQFANYLNQLCVGTELVALLKADGGDGEFADRLKTRRFVNFEYADNAKALKGYRKLWQEGQ